MPEAKPNMIEAGPKAGFTYSASKDVAQISHLADYEMKAAGIYKRLRLLL
jgi:hypothetical protein